MTIQRFETNRRMSQAVVHGGAAYLAGQVAYNKPDTSIAEQTADILAGVDRLLALAGTDKSRIITATIWLSDIQEYDEMNGVWDEWLPEGAAPARACVEAKLAAPQFRIEISVTAALP